MQRSAGSPLATRVLADGTAMVVADGGSSVTVFRHDRDGALLSASAVDVSQSGRRIAIDAFGGVFLGEERYRTDTGSELLVMKYDGASGRRMWPEPVVVEADPVTNAIPQAGFATPAGDLLLVSPQLILLDGATGRIAWGPTGPGVSGPMAVSFDRAGDVVVSGTAPWTDESPEAYLTYKVSRDTGALLWGPMRVGRNGGPGACPMSCPDPRAVLNALGPAGDVILSVASFDEPDNEQWLTLKYRGDTGTVLWGPVAFDLTDSWDYEMPTALAVDSAGDVLVGGSGWGSPDFTVLKFDGMTGLMVWGPVALGSSGNGLALAGNGDPVVTGVETTGDRSSWVATRLNGRTGGVSWQQAIADDTEWGSPGAPLLFGDGTALVTGLSSTALSSHLKTLRFSLANGALLWERQPQRAGGIRSAPVAHLVDESGDSLVVATLLDTAGGGGGIVKYAGATGVRLWGPVAFEDGPREWASTVAAALDAQEDLVVLGLIGDGSEGSWQLIKLSGADGSRIWGPVRAPSGGYGPVAVTVDAAGDVVATGGDAAGWMTRKFRGGDGGLVWESPTAAPSWAGQHRPAGVVVDASGDVVVAGVLGENYERGRAVVVKLAGATGTPLWGPRLFELSPGSGNNDQFGFLGLDATGDVLVLGVSRNVGDTLGESVLVKFEGESGTVVWSKFVAPGAPYPTGFLVEPQSGDVFVRVAAFPNDDVSRWSGRDGSRIWSLDRNVPAPPYSDRPLMILDAEGSLVLGGPRYPEGTFATAYDPATGQLRWGPVNLDPSGQTSPSFLVRSREGFVLTSDGPGPAVTASFALGFGIATLADEVPPGTCGESFDFPLRAENGAAPYGWSLVAGALPEGLSLASSGALDGEPTATGHFEFRVRATDASGNTAERDLALDVFDGGEAVPIAMTREAYCARLEAPEGFSAYEWLPGGQTARAIRACPSETALFGVVVTETSGCRRKGSIEVPAATPAARGPVLSPARRALPRKR